MDRIIREQIIEMLRPKLDRFSIKENELNDSFDLVKSGFVNSLEFVELITRLEKHFSIEIDFEKALEARDFTTLGGLAKIIQKQRNG